MKNSSEFEQLAQMIAGGFAEVNGKLDALDTRVGGLEQRVATLTEDVAALQADVTDTKQKVGLLYANDRRLTLLEDRLRAVEAHIGTDA